MINQVSQHVGHQEATDIVIQVLQKSAEMLTVSLLDQEPSLLLRRLTFLERTLGASEQGRHSGLRWTEIARSICISAHVKRI